MELDSAQPLKKLDDEVEHVLMYPKGKKERPIHRASKTECERVMRARLVDTALSGSQEEVARYFVVPYSKLRKK